VKGGGMKHILTAAAIMLLLLMSGCRTRTGLAPAEELAHPAEPPAAEDVQDSMENPDPQDPEEPSRDDEEVDPDASSVEDPEAERREYEENADAEVFPDAEDALVTEVGGEGASDGADPADDVYTSDDEAELGATEEVPADEADLSGADDSGELADSALNYYSVLLQDRLSSLFECQRLNVYWETQSEYTTIFKSSFAHGVIIDAGAYDVASRLLEENLLVDDGWIKRKNPGAIVKVVDGSVLGSGIGSDAVARDVLAALETRPGWETLDAVQSGRIMLLSEELLRDQSMRLAASVYLAKAMYPTLFEDTDPGEALRMLSEEAYGSAVWGIYFYSK